jgi:integrase
LSGWPRLSRSLFTPQADGIGKISTTISRLRVKTAKRNIVPLSVDEVTRFWSSFRTSRDLAIVGLMLLQGLRSGEVLALNHDDVLLPEAQIRVRGKGTKFVSCLSHLKPFNCSITIYGWSVAILTRERCLFR